MAQILFCLQVTITKLVSFFASDFVPIISLDFNIFYFVLLGEKLAAKLRELEQEKMRLEWERAEESRKVAAEQAARQEDQRRLRLKEQHLRQQEVHINC